MGSWSVRQFRVFIVENKVNLLTVPPLSRTIGIGALGKAVSLLRYLSWLGQMEVTYWGDLDVEGFEILSDMRAIYPQTRSVLMDEVTLLRWRQLAGRGTGRKPCVPTNLTAAEKQAFVLCCESNLRLEQERLPQQAVFDALTGSDSAAAHPLPVTPNSPEAGLCDGHAAI
jgi:hypothetical protein